MFERLFLSSLCIRLESDVPKNAKEPVFVVLPAWQEVLENYVKPPGLVLTSDGSWEREIL